MVVFHEQVIEMIAQFAGCTYAEGDEWRRALGDKDGMAETKTWFYPRALGQGYPLPVVEQIWKVIEAFASFGFCKAHAAAFALPTYQSAWLKAHYPAHFISGVLTHDPGMYPKRLILDDARQLGIAVLGLDVNASEAEYVVEKLADAAPAPRSRARSRPGDRPVPAPGRDLHQAAGAGEDRSSPPGWATGGASGSRWGRCAASTTARCSRIVTGPRGCAVRLADRLLAARPGRPGRWSSGWCRRAPSTPSTASAPPAAPVAATG